MAAGLRDGRATISHTDSLVAVGEQKNHLLDSNDEKVGRLVSQVAWKPTR